MSRYATTRGGPAVELAEAVFRGLAPDGGLYVPEELSRLPDPAVAAPLGMGAEWGRVPAEFVRAARWAAPTFFPSVEGELLDRVVQRALRFPAPIVEVEAGCFVLELFHGPTLAFKDVGARFMASLMPVLDGPQARALPPRTVLVATSGDTGGAVASAFHGIAGYRVVVLFPFGGVSERQRRQMTTLGGNVQAVAVDGSFDDCQRLAKAAFADPKLSEAHRLTSANSINVARLLPQAFYYVHAALTLGSVHFVVPSGNLGNLCAGLLAARAGMPVAGFTAAVNANRAFSDFLLGAPFRPRASVRTASSAMDVGDPSNLERIRWLYGGDDACLRRDVHGVSVQDEEAARCIRDVHDRTGYVMDPHTAVAYEAMLRRGAVDDGVSRVVLSTAHPAKFPETVETAIGRGVAVPASLERVRHAEEHMIHIEPAEAALARALEPS
jgi:threonine synthase